MLHSSCRLLTQAPDSDDYSHLVGAAHQDCVSGRASSLESQRLWGCVKERRCPISKSTARSGVTIGLLHHVGGGNLGDDATLQTVIASIKTRWPRAETIVFSLNPDDTEQRHKTLVYPARRRTWSFGYRPRTNTKNVTGRLKRTAQDWPAFFRIFRVVTTLLQGLVTAFRELRFLTNSFLVVRACDVFVVCGGGQLTEWGGPWGFPYTIWKWIVLAKLAGARCLVLNVGAGPLMHPLSIFFTKRALVSADYVSFRDSASRKLLYDLGFASPSDVFPDSAYNLEVSPDRKSSATISSTPIVGIAPMPYLDPRTFPPEKDQSAYDDYIQKLASFAAALSARSYAVALFGTDIGVDPLAITDVETAMCRQHFHYRAHELTRHTVRSLSELLTQIASMDYVVTCRFHGVVFAHLLNKPVLAIAHHPKVAILMRDLGLSEYCVDIKTFDTSLLLDRFEAVVFKRDEIKNRMDETLSRYKQQLMYQFDHLFPSAPQVAGV
jgi:polysaccharide pyruvyl transferase WcaK-like protein